MSRTSVAAVPPPRQPFDANSPDGAPRVLIIEGDHVTATTLQRMLRELGYDAWAAATTAREAHELAAEKVPHVVVADARIKGPIDGIVAAFELRQHSCGDQGHDRARSRSASHAAGAITVSGCSDLSEGRRFSAALPTFVRRAPGRGGVYSDGPGRATPKDNCGLIEK